MTPDDPLPITDINHNFILWIQSSVYYRMHICLGFGIDLTEITVFIS